MKKEPRYGIIKERKRCRKCWINQKKNDDDDNNGGSSSGGVFKEEKCSTRDPESGWFHKGEHKQVFAYAIETACDKHGWILGYTVNRGNLHDSRTFKGLYDKIKFKKYDYAYDEYFDCYICPNNKILKYSTTNREGYREYKSCPQDCEQCPYLSKCTESQNHVKVVTQHIWDDYLEICEDIRCTRGNKELYKKRKETIERLFGTAKEHHGFRYTQMVGKTKMEMKVGLTFACLNLKKLAKILDKRQLYTDFLRDLFDSLLKLLYFFIEKEKSRFSVA